jgi:protein involved in polysaccharide export with SLBB domain
MMIFTRRPFKQAHRRILGGLICDFALLAVVAFGCAWLQEWHEAYSTGSFAVWFGDLRNIIWRGDQLLCCITDTASCGECQKLLRVNPAGEVSLTLLGRVDVAGLTTRQAEQLILAKYTDAKVLERGEVSISIESH